MVGWIITQVNGLCGERVREFTRLQRVPSQLYSSTCDNQQTIPYLNTQLVSANPSVGIEGKTGGKYLPLQTCRKVIEIFLNKVK